MKLLLDTHTFLWFVTGNPRLDTVARQAIQNRGSSVFLSVASMWELVIKHALGKLPLPQPPEIYLPAQRRLHQIASLRVDEASVA